MSEKNLVLTDDLFEKLPEEEKNSEFIAVAIKTFAKDAWDRFRKNKLALAGLIFLIVMILLAMLAHKRALHSRRIRRGMGWIRNIAAGLTWRRLRRAWHIPSMAYAMNAHTSVRLPTT